MTTRSATISTECRVVAADGRAVAAEQRSATVSGSTIHVAAVDGPAIRRRPLAPELRHRDERPCPPDAPPPTVRIILAGDEHPLWAARRAIQDHCRGRVSDAVVDDLRIIASELVTNVLEHGDGPDDLAVELTFGDCDVHLRVVGHGDRCRLPPFDDWTLPAATRRSGRGLALVRRLARDVAVGGAAPTPGVPGWVRITASVPITTD